MSTAQFGAIANAKKGDNWAFVDSSGSYLEQSILKIPSGGYYLYTSYSYVLTKLTDDGRVVWQKTLPVAADLKISEILADGTLLIEGFRDEVNDKGVIGRLNPDTGNFVWYKYFIMGFYVQAFTTAATKDSTDTHGYVTFTRNTAADPNLSHATISQFNLSNGSINWTREILSPTGFNSYSLKAKVDGSGNVYLTGVYIHDSSNNLWRGFLIKFNSSGTVQWQRLFTRNNTADFTDYFFTEGVAIDSFGNIHVPGTHRYAGSPTFGICLYYAKVDPSGNLLNHYSILPDPVPVQDFPTQIESVRNPLVDSSGNFYMSVYGRFNLGISNQYTGTIVKISGGNTLSYLSTLYFGNSVTEGFSGPGGMAIDTSANRLMFNVYRFTGGPEVVSFNVPSDGSASGITVAPKALKASYRDIMPATLAAPPVTFGAASTTIRNGTEAYTFEDISVATASTATYDKYIQRF